MWSLGLASIFLIYRNERDRYYLIGSYAFIIRIFLWKNLNPKVPETKFQQLKEWAEYSRCCGTKRGHCLFHRMSEIRRNCAIWCLYFFRVVTEHSCGKILKQNSLCVLENYKGPVCTSINQYQLVFPNRFPDFLTQMQEYVDESITLCQVVGRSAPLITNE